MIMGNVNHPHSITPPLISSSPHTTPPYLHPHTLPLPYGTPIMSKFDRPKSAAFINRSCSCRLLSSIDHATIGCFHQSIMQLSAAFTPLCQSKNATSPLMIHRLKHRSRPSIHRCHQSMPSIGPIDRCHRSVPSIDAIDRSHRSMPSIGPIDRCHRSMPYKCH